MPTIIMTDSNTEIPLWLKEKYDIPVVQMPYTLDGVEYTYDLGEKIDIQDFYRRVRGGSMPITSTYSPQFYVDFWQPMLEAGNDILFICFSSGLSSVFSHVEMAREMVRQTYPERTITLVDTKSISRGAALLVYKALQMREAGASIEEITLWLENNKMRAQHWFTVDDLFHLKRGGRLSGAAAAVGTLVNLKPVLTVNRQGQLVVAEKVIGRKKAMRTLLKRLEELAEDPEHNVLCILHADCLEEGRKLEQMVREQMNFAEVWLDYVGPVIGTHAGPGTLAFTFMGKERES